MRQGVGHGRIKLAGGGNPDGVAQAQEGHVVRYHHLGDECGVSGITNGDRPRERGIGAVDLAVLVQVTVDSGAPAPG